MRTTSARLDPVGRIRLPRRTTLLRLVAAAALLLTAAGVLYAGDRGPVEAGTPAPVSSTPPSSGPGGRPAIPDGTVGVPVTLGDPAALALLQPGDRVDLFAVAAGGGEPDRLAGDTPVLAVDRTAAAVLLALPPDQSRAVLSAPAGTVFAVIVRGLT